MPHWLYEWSWLRSPRFWLDAIAVLTLLTVTGRLTRYKWPFIVFVLPGTIAHELAHWSMALLLRGKPTPPSFWPHTEGRRWVLGHVLIRRPRWYNLPPIALAPLLLLPLAITLYWHWLRFYPLLQWRHWLGVYFVATLLRSASPSPEDLRLLAAYRWPLLFIGAAGIGLLIAWRH